MTDEYLIWSWEHEAWWGPNHAGYTTVIGMAGVYTMAEVAHITCPHFPPGEEIAVLRSFVPDDDPDFRPPTYGCD